MAAPESLGPLQALRAKGRRCLIHREVAENLSLRKMWVRENLGTVEQKHISGDWVLYTSGSCPQSNIDFAAIMEAARNPDWAKSHGSKGLSALIQTEPWRGIIAEWYLADEQPAVALSPIAEVWKEIVGTPIIPFDKEERRRKLAHAFEALAPYIKAHEAEAEVRRRS